MKMWMMAYQCKWQRKLRNDDGENVLSDGDDMNDAMTKSLMEIFTMQRTFDILNFQWRSKIDM